MTLLISLCPFSKSKPQMKVFRDGQLAIVRFDQGLHFASNETLLDFFHEILDEPVNMSSENRLELCVVDLESVWKMDYPSALTLASLKEYFSRKGVAMFFTRPRTSVLRFLLRATGDRFPVDWHIFPDLHSALQDFAAKKEANKCINISAKGDAASKEASCYGSINSITKVS